MFLPTSLEVVSELGGRFLVIGKHEVVADAFVFLAAVKQVRQGCLVEFAGTRGQSLGIVRSREKVCPLTRKLNISLGKTLDELLEDESSIEHHVMAHNGFFSRLQMLNDSREAKLPLVALLNFRLLFKSEIASSRSHIAIETCV